MELLPAAVCSDVETFDVRAAVVALVRVDALGREDEVQLAWVG
jgi:hypothetical protein